MFGSEGSGLFAPRPHRDVRRGRTLHTAALVKLRSRLGNEDGTREVVPRVGGNVRSLPHLVFSSFVLLDLSLVKFAPQSLLMILGRKLFPWQNGRRGVANGTTVGSFKFSSPHRRDLGNDDSLISR